MTPDLQSRIASWRTRAAEGTLTLDEMKEAIAHLRAGRISAAYASETSRRKKAVKEIPHADDLLADFERELGL